MARPKFDIVIETVRYAADGKIEVVRAFERRGPAFSDHFLITRQNLFEKLKAGKKCVTGQRQEFLAGTFVTGKDVQISADFISTSPNAEKDFLEDVPIF